MTENEIQKIIDPDLFFKYKLFLRNTELSMNPNLRFCPKVDCQGYDVGNLKKHKLVCNLCGLEYCYYCNESWHPGVTCKNSQEIKFDQWSAHHDVKYCPNCKRRIEKAGGCPSMECPVCKANWCWYCGKSITTGHDPILCLFIKDSWELRYWLVFFLIFGPITIPFGVGMFLIHLGQNYLTDSDKESKLVAKVIKLRVLTYPLIIAFSPFLTVLLLLGSGFFIIYINRSVFQPYNSGCYSKAVKSKYSRLCLMLLLGSIISGVLASLSIIGLILSPVVGLGFLAGKVSSDISKICHKSKVKTEKYVPIGI
jgi:IBR domain, a half RING-finger domain